MAHLSVSMLPVDAGDVAKKLYIKTYGCQMNVYDSDRMAHSLAAHGYLPVAAPDDADLVVLNTCHIREKAAEKVYSELGRLRRLRDARREDTGREMVLAVAGCVAQAEGELLVERAPFVDIVVGPQAYHRLPELLARRAAVGRRGGRHRVPGREQVRPSAPGPADRRRQRVPDHPGRLRQVLHLLRRSLHARCGAEPARHRHPARGARPRRQRCPRAHAAGSERQRLPR